MRLSKIRNKALAHAFLYMNLIEEWGTGIPKLIQEMQADSGNAGKKSSGT